MQKYDEFIRRHFLPQKINQEFDVEKYLSDLENGLFNDRFNLGVLEKNSGEWLLRDFSENPNAAFIGAMGSGKSQGAKFSIFTWMLANSHKTQLFIVDTLKGAGDYSKFFRKDSSGKNIYPQVFEALNNIDKAIKIIDLVWGEYEERQKLFKTINSNSMKDFEKKTGRTINRLIILFEEVHNIFQLIDFKNTYKTTLSPANKLWMLLRVGRAAGIWFFMCSQKGTSSDIAPEVITNLVNKMIFKVQPTEASYLIGNSEAASIQATEQGRCLTESGFVQFPFLADDEQVGQMLDHFMKPLQGEFAFLNTQMIEDVVEGNSLKEFYKNKKMAELMMAIESHDSSTVISVLHEKLGHQVSEMEEGNNMDISHIIDVSKDIKMAVITRAKKDRNNVNPKHLNNLIRAMNVYECTKGIIYTSSSKITSALYKTAKEHNIEIVDYEDLIKFAVKIDKEGSKIKFDPSQIADEEKESGEYQRKNKIFAQEEDESGYQTFDETVEKESSDILSEIIDSGLKNVEPKKDVQDVEESKNEPNENFPLDDEYIEHINQESEIIESEPKIEESSKIIEPKKDVKNEVAPLVENSLKEIENILTQKNTLSKVAKRVPAKKVFTLKKDATPTLMIHVHRNDSGDVYRILFNVIEENKIKHQFYVDRQVLNQFSHKEKAMLGINSLDEWNNQKDVLDPDRFDSEVMSFLGNFESCQFPVHSVCWKSDAETVKRYLRPCKYMIDNPQTFEDIMFNNYGLNYSRKEMIDHYSIKVPKSPTIYNPIEMDFSLWLEIN